LRCCCIAGCRPTTPDDDVIVVFKSGRTIEKEWAPKFRQSGKESMGAETAGTPLVIVEGDASGFAQRITIGAHQFAADESLAAGGTDTGPDPYQLLLAALGSCTSMTVALYARRKQWPLQRVRVQLTHSRIHVEDCAHCDTNAGRLDRIERALDFDGPLSTDQRRRLIEIADRCPVHRTLTSDIHIVTRLVERSPDRTVS
jgi:uncharacterized OsmC-like protein